MAKRTFGVAVDGYKQTRNRLPQNLVALPHSTPVGLFLVSISLLAGIMLNPIEVGSRKFKVAGKFQQRY